MSKEMIVSVNGREKKIAIIENGRVTEFYIERGGEENAGVVGNIYKGRVQRVLPGMQSAFVSIGLERDAFLYVSDFFDEEEEIERIIQEKGKKVPAEMIEREVSDELQRARLEREKQMEAAQEIAEPLAAGGIAAQPEAEEKPDKAGAPEAAEVLTDPDAGDEPSQQQSAQGRRGRSRRHKDRRDDSSPAAAAPGAEETGSRQPAARADRSRGGASPEDADVWEIAERDGFSDERRGEEAAAEPFFEIEDASGFERVIDDEETTGEMFKDAYLQEAIIDKVRAIEFDIEGAASAEVGSLFDTVSGAAGGFERIADDEPTAAGSDDKYAAAGGRAPASDDEESQSPKGKRKGSKRDAKKQQKKKSDSLPGMAEEAKAESPEETEAAAETSDAPEKAKTTKGRKSGGGGRKGKRAKEGDKAGDAGDAGAAENIEVVMSEPADIAEMAVRRGGRRRGGSGGGGGGDRGDRRPPQNRSQSQQDERFDGSDRGGDGDGNAAAASGEDSGESRSRNGSGGGGRDHGSRRGNDDRGGRRSQPTITDLLREGQEILVQMAKEPIARKGARITSHIALPGRYLVYMPTIEHLGVSRKIESSAERGRLRNAITKIRTEETVPSGGFIVRTAGVGVSEQNLRDDARYLVRTWLDIKKTAEKSKSPALVHQDLDLVQRLLRDQLSEDFAAIRIDSEEEYLRIAEFVNRIQPRMVNRVKLYTRDQPILEHYGVQEEVDKALKPRVWLKSGGYLVINQTEALVAIDVNTGKFVGKGGTRLEDTITRTNMEAVEEIARQIRLRDLGGILVLDLIDMEDRRNRHKVMQALQEALQNDKSPTKVLSFNDFGLVIMTRKRVKQSLERTLCAPCSYCQGAGLVKSPQTICYEILEEARHLSRNMNDVRQTTLRVNPEVANALRGAERAVLEEIEAYLGAVDLTSDTSVHQEQFDFAFI